MNAYFMVEDNLFKKEYLNIISTECTIIRGNSNNQENYNILKEDDYDKIIVYDPDYAGWAFPDRILNEIKNIIHSDLLNSMKDSSILISATGKQLFNSEVIESKLKNNELFGYAFEEPNASLDKYDNNVMVTSEYGWFTKEASALRIEKWSELIIHYLKGNHR